MNCIKGFSRLFGLQLKMDLQQSLKTGAFVTEIRPCPKVSLSLSLSLLLIKYECKTARTNSPGCPPDNSRVLPDIRMAGSGLGPSNYPVNKPSCS